MFVSGSLMRVQYPKSSMIYDPYREFNPNKNCVYILAEVSISIIIKYCVSQSKFFTWLITGFDPISHSKFS